MLLIGLMIILVSGLTAASAQDSGIVYDYDELNVAGATPMSGNFFCSLWGNNTSDIDVRMLLHGYNLVEFQSEEGTFEPDDTVISGMVVTEDAAGNRTYTIALYNDLYYSDGTRITARDYAFSMLLTMSKEAAAIGGDVKRPEYLLGYRDYINGTVPYLAGVRVLADDMFSITISADYLPFFYELGLLDCYPYPISVIAPGVRVADDGRGVYLTNETDGPAVFTADLLRRTILDPNTGYLTHPTVTSGPYKLVSYENGVVTVELNERFKGDSHGFKPTIKTLKFKSMPVEEMIPAFTEGSVGLLNKVTSASVIQNGVAAISGSDTFAVANYPRTGLTFISFNTERPIVDEVEVRQAIAYAMDKDEFIAGTVGDFGLRVEGYYGMGQWMYQLLSGTLDYPVEDEEDPEAAQREWEALELDSIQTYTYQPESAMDLLEAAGWTLNADGGEFTPGTDSLRYKRFSGELIPLKLTLAYPEGTSATEPLKKFADDLAVVGMKLEMTAMPMDDLLTQYYSAAERKYDMFFLGSNFVALFDPSSYFVMNNEGSFVWAETGLADDDLYYYAVQMRRTESGDLLEYCKHWLEFQQRFAEVLPMIPLYSNVYFDFYPRVLHDYDPSANLSWSQAVVPAYMSDVEAETAVPEDDEMIIVP